MKREPENRSRSLNMLGRARAKAHRKGIHRQAKRDQQDFDEIHTAPWAQKQPVSNEAYPLLTGDLCHWVHYTAERLLSQAEALRTEGASVMHLAVDGQLAGLLAVSDPIKPSTPEALATLKAENHRLERELLRKDKALAEAAALLVLQKKFRALLGGEVE